MSDDPYAWARALVGSWVLHTDTGVVDQIKDFEETPSLVRFHMAQGHTLVVKQENFIALTEEEHQFYKLSEGVIAHAIRETLTLGAASKKVRLGSACVLLEAALTAQLRALQVNNKRAQG